MIKIASHKQPWQGCDVLEFSLFSELALVEEFSKIVDTFKKEVLVASTSI